MLRYRAARPVGGRCLELLWMLEPGIWCFLLPTSALFSHQPFELFQTRFQLRVLRFESLDSDFDLLIQSLNRRQRHAAFVHSCDVSVILANVERGGEVLRHGAEMPH